MLITVVGNIGSGKSTAVPIIAKKIKSDILDADNLFQTSDPFAQRYLENQQRWAMVNELWLTFERVKLIEEKLKTLKKKHLVIDSGVLISWVYTYGHYVTGTITEDEWDLYQNLYDRLSSHWLEGACVIHLQYSIPTLLQRIHKRGRDFELEFYNAEYLQKIDHGLAALRRKLEKQDIQIITISEAEVVDFENNQSDRKKLLELVMPIVDYI